LKRARSKSTGLSHFQAASQEPELLRRECGHSHLSCTGAIGAPGSLVWSAVKSALVSKTFKFKLLFLKDMLRVRNQNVVE
jgi:hypothetical protein